MTQNKLILFKLMALSSYNEVRALVTRVPLSVYTHTKARL